MIDCVLCKAQLSENEKPEHILLDALGGRKTTRDVLCSICNNKMGAGPDKDLAESAGSASDESRVSFKSSSRNLPLKLSTKAFCIGFPGAM
ncbi:HNH endonuclease [Cognatiyoonia sp. IB215182]|uniref:HNH endonuclease n=1 Tax=Cognatiyoonia sp. IB215182 TaxID=3097353 RepID=UPI0039B75BFB